MRIVEFENGKFAIRVIKLETILSFEHQYIQNNGNDLESLLFWTRSSNNEYFDGCLFNTLEEAREFIKKIKKIKKRKHLKAKRIYKV